MHPVMVPSLARLFAAALALAAVAPGQARPVVVRGPYLQGATAAGIVVRWRTDVPTDTRLWTGATPAALQLVHADPALATEHAVTLAGLGPATQLHYAVGDSAGVLAGGDAEHRFRTLPQPGTASPLRFVALGDVGLPWIGQSLVRDAFLQFTASRPADLALLLGDNAYYTGTDPEYQAGLFTPYQQVLRNTCAWSTIGNHDAMSASVAQQSGPYFDVFDLPAQGQAGGVPSGTEAYYAFDHGHVHFVCLDSEATSRAATGAMAQWLAADLAATTATWVVAIFHHPPYTKGTHDSDRRSDSGGRMHDMREVFVPILEAHGVDLVLCGHSHGYERSFLLDGHTGLSTTLVPSMVLDRGDGTAALDGTYAKPTLPRAAHEGTVYVVAGSAGTIGAAPMDHPAMHFSRATMGSLVVDVDGSRLDAAFVDYSGAVLDRFTIEKGVRRTLFRDVPSISAKAGGMQSFSLQAGAGLAGCTYLLMGSFGTSPGHHLGSVHVPLVQDDWLAASIGMANGMTYPDSFGWLDAGGAAAAQFLVPDGTWLPFQGMSLYHAFLAFDATGPRFASNAVRLRIVP